MEMHLRLSVKTNCRIFKELTRPLSRARAMNSAISIEIALVMTRRVAYELVEPVGIEPTTFALQTRRSPS